MIAYFIDSVHESSDIYTFRFRPEKRPDYTPGQFIDLTIAHDADERGNRRWFTLSSSPSEETVSITTRISEQAGSSFKVALQSLKPNDQVTISDPMGDFVLPIDKTIPITFVAAGIGITPIRSMVKWLLDKEEKRDAQLIYAVSTPTDAVFSDIFSAYNLPTHLVVTQANDEEAVAMRLDASKILKLSPDTENRLFYISGPEPMVEKLVDELERAGIEKSRLVTDYFLNYSAI